MLDKKYLLSAAAGAAAVASLGIGAFAFAQTPSTTSNTSGAEPMHRLGVGGTVTAVQGNVITVTGMDGKTYTIDASSASITKDETISVSDVKVGDMVGAMGTLSGSSLSATNIHDGKMPPMGMHGHGPRPNDNDADDAPGASTSNTTSTTQQ